MADTTLTFSIITDQAEVELVNDPSEPGWDDILAPDLQSEENNEEDGGEDEKS